MDLHFIFFVIIGFVAQVIDGALGMAYGVSATTVLLSFGISPVMASASVHTAEIFTSGVSGLSHLKFGNVDKGMLKPLLFAGVIGGVIGAYILTEIPGEKVKPFVSLYLLIMGLVILLRAFNKESEGNKNRKVFPLGLLGGFFDAIGGGGWGPIVTSTLVGRGHSPRFSIGTVNLAEFFVTVSQVVVFVYALQIMNWKIILGLILGGIIAAPLGALLTKKLPTKPLMVFVGILVMLISIKVILEGNWVSFWAQ